MRRDNPYPHKRLLMRPSGSQILGFVLLLVLLNLFPPLSVQAAPSRNATLLRLHQYPKLLRPDETLQGFYLGALSIRVTVSVQKSADFPASLNLDKKDERDRLRNAVVQHLSPLMADRDPNKVQVHRIFDYMPGFAADVTPEGLEWLLQRPDVLSVQQDHILQAHTAQGIPLMDASNVRSQYGGQGVSIAVCDTGIDYTHSKLGGGGFPNAKVIGGTDIGGSSCSSHLPSANPMDLYGHGTSCAGIAAGDIGSVGDYIGGVAPQAKLYAVKIACGNTGNAYESDMISGWEWCITHKNDDSANPILIISTSFGGSGFAGYCDSYDSLMTQAAANAVAAGITLFASAGNNGYCGQIAWPACISNVISVGAVFDANIGGGFGFCVDASSCAANKQAYSSCSTGYVAWVSTTQADQVTPYSNVSATLDLFAPSHNAYTTALGGGYTPNFGGTSAACPYAAGAAACLQSAYKAATGQFMTPAALRAALTGSGDPITYTPAGLTKPRVNLGAADGSVLSTPAMGMTGYVLGACAIILVALLSMETKEWGKRS